MIYFRTKADFFFQMFWKNLRPGVPHNEARQCPIPWTFGPDFIQLTVAFNSPGWSAWNWQRHMQQLSLPEPLVAGLDLNALSGIKTISTIMVVIIHRVFQAVGLPHSNLLITRQVRHIPPLISKYSIIIILTAVIAEVNRLTAKSRLSIDLKQKIDGDRFESNGSLRSSDRLW